jgi:hypothetical protein
MLHIRKADITFNRRAATAVAACLPVALVLCNATMARAAGPSHDEDAQARAAWRAVIAEKPVPGKGCFTASYPSRLWRQVACTAAPARRFLPRSGLAGLTVGDGNDYAAAAVGGALLSETIGAFPTVKGVKSETGLTGANDYSLQLNSQFYTTKACKYANDPSQCLGWQQFVYSSNPNADGTGYGFMQYWLINYGSKCPTKGSVTWMSYSGDCYANSNAIVVPLQAITQLEHLKVTGKAVREGVDTFTLTTASDAYSVTGDDSVVYLAQSWNASEFNVIGDGDGSEADFNSGASVTVKISLKDGLKTAPACESEAGTTAETNNLNLGTCKASAASNSVEFTESN